MSNTIKVIDKLSGSVLFETNFEDLNSAYSYAKLMESEGVDVDIISPSLPESLLQSLGANSHELATLEKEIADEINTHEDDAGCATCFSTNKN